MRSRDRKHNWRTLLRRPWATGRRLLQAAEAYLLPRPIDLGLRRGLCQIRAAADPGAALAFRRTLAGWLEQAQSGNPLILMPPSLDWSTQLFQRPQQLARALARQGAVVVFCEKGKRMPEEDLQPPEDRLYRCPFPPQALEEVPGAWTYVLTWNARRYLPALTRPAIVYDYLDEIEAFYGNPTRLSQDHRALLREAKLVLATSELLYQAARAVRPDTFLVPNGADYEHFARRRRVPPDSAPPALQPVLDRGAPIIGYYGALARWFDYDLVREVARLRPDLQFVLLGPDFDFSLAQQGWQDLENLRWLGPQPYNELPSYLHFFNVAMIPFRLNRVTRATSPIKLYEYFAGGKPVVATNLPECARIPEVMIARDPKDFSAQLDRALALRSDPSYLSRIDALARANTWEARAGVILGALGELGPGGTALS
ncbi:MAG: glycosyltransferase [Anaerolineales bacterium]